MPRKKAVWLVTQAAGPQGRYRQQNRRRRTRSTPYENEATNGRTEVTPRLLAISSLSVGLSIVGAFGHPVMSMASVPLTLYTALPEFKHAWAAIVVSKRIRGAVVWSVVLLALLATKRFLAASLLSWTHDVTLFLSQRLRHLNQRVIHSLFVELDHNARQLLLQLYGTKPDRVWLLVEGSEIEVPFEDVNIGDCVVSTGGEIVPFEGTVCEGAAVVNRFILTGETRSVSKGLGDHVIPMTRVVSGRITVRVERL